MVDAVKKAKAAGAKVLGFIDVETTELARMVDWEIAYPANEQLKFFMVADRFLYRHGEFDEYDVYYAQLDAHLARDLVEVEKAADAFGFEAMFMHCWRLRERVLDLFEKTTGGRVILSVVKVGGVVRDIDATQMAEIVSVLDGIKDDYTKIMNTLLTDTSVKNRTVDVGYISTEDARALSMVGPFARASNLPYDVRSFGKGAYGDLADFQPITATEGDCYARVKVRCLEVLQSIEIIKELAAKMPAGPIEVAVKGTPAEGAEASNVLEQPRGECYYYARGNGTKNLERMRIRTPTSQNLAGMTVALKGCDLADVNMIILTIDPCISCTER